MAGNLIGPQVGALVPVITRRMKPLSLAFVMISSTASALLLNALVKVTLKRRGLKRNAAGIGGAGIGAAAIFAWSRGIEAIFPLFLAIVLPLAWSRPRRRSTSSRDMTHDQGTTSSRVDPVFSSAPKILSPSPFARASVRSYAAPRAPHNIYSSPATAAEEGQDARKTDPPQSSRNIAPASSVLITPVRGGGTAVCAGQNASACVGNAGKMLFEAVGWAQLPGQKNEDTLCISTTNDMEYVAVFDGHRGQGVAAWIANTLHGYIETSYQDSLCNPRRALETAFQTCNESLRSMVDISDRRGGATAVVLCAIADGIWCANVGDCRAVACTSPGTAERLSVDHTPSAPGEAERVTSCGGIVEFNCLDGDLEVTRSFGAPTQILCCFGCTILYAN